MLLLVIFIAVDTGVVCIPPLPPVEHAGTAGKGGAVPELYDDSPEARAARVEHARKTRKPVVYSIGAITSAPVTDKLGACIDGIEIGKKQQLKAGGEALFTFVINTKEPVRMFTSSLFYGGVGLDSVPERLYCPTRSKTPDCSWCPCRSRKYVPPPRPASQP